MGQTTWVWTKVDRAKNEILDCTVYSIAASIKYGVAWISDQGWQKLRELESPPAADKPPVIGPAVTAAQQAEMTKKPTLAGRLAR
jgi:phage terminase large subunit GpA-like protein